MAHLKSVAATIPAPALPDFTLRDMQALAPGAIALALLIFAEGVLLARTLAARHREAVAPDQELTALGVGNVAAGLVGGFPVGASTSRSVTADAAGAQTQLAQWIAAALLAAFVLFLAPALDALPRVALAAILVAAGVRLFDARALKSLRDLDRRAYGLALAVTIGVLILGVLPGVLLGVVLSVARVMIEVARPRDALLRRLPTDRRFHDLADDEGGAVTPSVLVYRLYAPLIFANARHVADRLRATGSGGQASFALRGARPAGGVACRCDRVDDDCANSTRNSRATASTFASRGPTGRCASSSHAGCATIVPAPSASFRLRRPPSTISWLRIRRAARPNKLCGDRMTLLRHPPRKRQMPGCVRQSTPGSRFRGIDGKIARLILSAGDQPLRGLELRVFQRQPLHARIAEVHLHLRIGPAATGVDDHAECRTWRASRSARCAMAMPAAWPAAHR